MYTHTPKPPYFLLFTIVVWLLAACVAPTPAGPRSLTVMTHDSFAMTDSVLKEFETANNVTVAVLKSGDAGTMLNVAILNKSAPLADVLYGVDNQQGKTMVSVKCQMEKSVLQMQCTMIPANRSGITKRNC